MNLFQLLNLPEGSPRSTILDAYQQKRAELSYLPEKQEELNQLVFAYEQWLTENQTDLALSTNTAKKVTNTQTDPALLVVRSISDPIGEQPTLEYTNCIHCGSQNPVNAQTCSNCSKQISRSCPNCGKIITINAVICPRCQTVTSDLDRQRLVASLLKKQHNEEEHTLSDKNRDAREEQHAINARWGCGFWLLVSMVGVGAVVTLFFILNILTKL